MGLDQYLSVEKYTSIFTDNDKAEMVRELFPAVGAIDTNLRTVRVRFDVAYWRKQYHINNFFKNHKGEDGFIERSVLIELRSSCLAAIANPSAFDVYFYTDPYDFDEYYDEIFDNLDWTAVRIQQILDAVPNNEDWNFYYRTS
jgi:hypothetical protein